MLQRDVKVSSILCHKVRLPEDFRARRMASTETPMMQNMKTKTMIKEISLSIQL
jgi:hypothetical protein